MKPLRRDLDAFNRVFDVLIIGAGAYGACIARLAARCGWSVALIERDDFGAAVSHNSLKIVHGGLRYVQHFDLPRIRETMAAQRAWLRAAPHLVRPLRCVIPAYGHGTRGPLALAAGLCVFHVVTSDRNRGLAAASRLPRSGMLSRRALLALYPELLRRDVKGGAYWYDLQMLDANRLTLECVQDASDRGAIVANHVEALQLLRTDHKVEGVAARDGLTGREFEVLARVTVNATGPWVERLLSTGSPALKIKRPPVWTRNVNLVTRRLFDTGDAFGVGSQRASDAALGQSQRLFFVTPWQDCSIIGTSHIKHDGNAADLAESVKVDVEGFLSEVNEALPRLGLETDDLCYVHSGLTPAEDGVERSKRSNVVDHASADGVRGLVSVLGIKFTTAPVVADRVVTAISRVLRKSPASPVDFSDVLPGGQISGTGGTEAQDGTAESEDRKWAARIYGARAAQLFQSTPKSGLSLDEHSFRCRVLYGVENEMVMRLRDAVFRASDLAERGHLTVERLTWCANTLAQRLGWNVQRRDAELSDVYARLGKSMPPSALAKVSPKP